jgi:hypothetical protein
MVGVSSRRFPTLSVGIGHNARKLHADLSD